jgi:DNA repair protein RadA/Sms
VACFGEVGLTGELRSVGHSDRRLAEARKFGLTPVIAPSGSEGGATEVPTLRAALRAALPQQPRARAV